MDFSRLEEKLGIKFANIKLLQQALTHRSYLNENPDWKVGHNERLEFLGDAVIELAVTEYLFREYSKPEGELTAYRAALVNAESLAKVATELGLDEHLLLSRGEAKEFSRSKNELLSNTFEALMGAIYMDQGYRVCQDFLERVLASRLPDILAAGAWRDPKSRFQEKAQELLGITPSYAVLREWGPDHAKQFLVAVYLENEEIAEGEGMSKQEAEMKAAQEALKAKNW